MNLATGVGPYFVEQMLCLKTTQVGTNQRILYLTNIHHVTFLNWYSHSSKSNNSFKLKMFDNMD